MKEIWRVGLVRLNKSTSGYFQLLEEVSTCKSFWRLQFALVRGSLGCYLALRFLVGLHLLGGMNKELKGLVVEDCERLEMDLRTQVRQWSGQDEAFQDSKSNLLRSWLFTQNATSFARSPGTLQEVEGLILKHSSSHSCISTHKRGLDSRSHFPFLEKASRITSADLSSFLVASSSLPADLDRLIFILSRFSPGFRPARWTKLPRSSFKIHCLFFHKKCSFTSISSAFTSSSSLAKSSWGSERSPIVPTWMVVIRLKSDWRDSLQVRLTFVERLMAWKGRKDKAKSSNNDLESPLFLVISYTTYRLVHLPSLEVFRGSKGLGSIQDWAESFQSLINPLVLWKLSI